MTTYKFLSFTFHITKAINMANKMLRSIKSLIYLCDGAFLESELTTF